VKLRSKSSSQNPPHDTQRIEALTQSLRNEPGRVDLALELATALEERGDFREALRLVERMAKKGATTPELVRLRAECLRRVGKAREAVEVLDAAKELIAGRPWVQITMGRCLAQAGEQERVAAEPVEDAAHGDVARATASA